MCTIPEPEPDTRAFWSNPTRSQKALLIKAWSWGTCRRQFGQDFEAKVWSKYQRWVLVKALRLKFGRVLEAAVWLRFGRNLKLNFGQDFEARAWSSCWSWSLVEILRLNFDVTLTQIHWLTETTLASVVPLAIVMYLVMHSSDFYFCTFSSWQQYIQ